MSDIKNKMDMTKLMKKSPRKARKRLASIRCVIDCINCIVENKPLPKELCFVADIVEYIITPEYPLLEKSPFYFYIWASPWSEKEGKVLGRIAVSLLFEPDTKGKVFIIQSFGEEFSNNAGDWIQITKESIQAAGELLSPYKEGTEGWILLHPRDAKVDFTPVLIPKHEFTESTAGRSPYKKDEIFGGEKMKLGDLDINRRHTKALFRWQHVVENSYKLQVSPPSLPPNCDHEAINHLSKPPPNWSLEADEELVRFLVDNCKNHDLYTNGANKYVESVTVSTEQESANNLLDGDPNTFWESDGSLGRHYIKLQMKSGVIIQRLIIGVDQLDDNYMPSRVLVYGCSDGGQSKMLNESRIDSCHTGDVVVLENSSEFYSMIEIRIKECKDDGIDCRIHYVKIVSSKQKQNGLSRDLFDKSLVRYPKLETIELKDRKLLYYRALALNRFIVLFDNVIQFLLPTWEYTAGTYKCIEQIRQLLPLSKKRQALIENCLRDSQSTAPSIIPKIYINRHLAAEHIVEPSVDPDAKNSVFHQLYEALRPERCEVKLDYRWPLKYEQWWECKFIGEGIIDQGGGFRDSISDLSEELCPSSQDNLLPLPLNYFVRSPNQSSSSNVYRDCYVPNADCHHVVKYEWVGQLMGACLRGKENLVISLPPLIWKMLSGESISFEQDYHTVDASEVKFHENLAVMDESKFKGSFEGILRFNTVLCNGNEVGLTSSTNFVTYENRDLYLKLAKQTRMNEFNEQVKAIRNGLHKVVPKAVLVLMTWQELEKRICGDPEITVDALKKSTHYEDFEDEDDITIRYFWQAIEKFTNEDRSRFLRFVTGRRRLPTPLYISKSKSSTPVNSLPESATCSHTLFLPNYSSATHAEEKLRYAAYNCIAIDADMGPWED